MTRYLLPLLLLAGTAHAQAPAWNENRITITAPTTCVNGRPIAECPFFGYAIERSASPAGPWVQIITLAPNTTVHTHTAVAGQNCYRGIATASAPFLSSLPSEIVCKTNTPPAPPPVPPNPPVLSFVTVAAVNSTTINATPVATILGSQPDLRGGSIVGLVPLNRVTQGPPLFAMLGRQWCRVEVGTKEVFTAGRSLLDLAAPCAARGA